MEAAGKLASDRTRLVFEGYGLARTGRATARQRRPFGCDSGRHGGLRPGRQGAAGKLASDRTRLVFEGYGLARTGRATARQRRPFGYASGRHGGCTLGGKGRQASSPLTGRGWSLRVMGLPARAARRSGSGGPSATPQGDMGGCASGRHGGLRIRATWRRQASSPLTGRGWSLRVMGLPAPLRRPEWIRRARPDRAKPLSGCKD
jgi:hypothetical protein